MFKETSESYYWEKGYEIHHLAAYFIFSVFFLTIAWVVSTLIWTGSLNQTRLFLNFFLPKNKQLSLEHFKTLVIVSAKYGTDSSFFDVTDKLKNMIESNTLTITASNTIAGDPIVGQQKKLTITYRYDGEDQKNLELIEGRTETIKPSDT